ncbi:hypothetical protein KKF32_02645 [Patescibacteria group bacterium]|nr:hypothetical protein [Patescibacteria group bacterium]
MKQTAHYLLRKCTFFGILGFIILLVVGVGTVAYVYASSTSEVNQEITAGTLTTDIRSDSTTPVASPYVGMSTKTFSYTCLSGGSASTGTFGSSTERIYIDNPDAADNGWTLTVSTSSTAYWASSASSTLTFDFNDTGGSGCTDGGDGDSIAGQMTVDPSGGSITADCGSCGTGNLSLGSSTGFNEGATDTITLLTAAADSDDIGRWYLTDVSVSQTIPAEQAATNYSFYMTVTITAS